jgi:glycosyltransferase involved in cell wall biosynthesis/thymidylate kinase
MRIAYITAEVPYPLTSGYLRHFHFLQRLSREHEIALLSLSRRGALDPESRAALEPLVRRLEVFPYRGGALARNRAALRLRDALAGLVSSGGVDAVLFSGKDTFPALRSVGAVPLVADVCDAASLRRRGELAASPWIRRPKLALRAAQLGYVERRLVARTPHLLFASERDRAALASRRGMVVPNGVDLAYWTRRSPPASEPVVAFTGVLAYGPNHDAALRLVTRVLPRLRERVPHARLVIAGRDPRPDLCAAAGEQTGVTLVRSPADLRTELERAAVYCAPLRFAAGIQNKLLEALAMELPVVASEVAAAGLRVAGAEPPLAVADDDDSVAAALAELLTDPAGRAELRGSGRRYVETHFSWERSAAAVDAALRDAVADRRSARRGFTVALIGCDGAGKTTVARALESDTDLPVSYLYMGVSPDSSNRLLPTTRAAHALKRSRSGSPRRGLRRSVRSALRLANRVAEEWYRQLIAVVQLRRGRIVVFDRHFAADFHASDVTGPGRTLSRRVHGFLLTHLYPRPDLVVFLDAPPEVLFARKGEGTIASLTRRRDEYRRLGATLDRFAVVEATQPLAQVVETVADLIREQGAAR